MSNLVDTLLKTVKLIDTVEQLDKENEKLANKVNEIDIRLAKIDERLKVYSEIQQSQKILE